MTNTITSTFQAVNMDAVKNEDTLTHASHTTIEPAITNGTNDEIAPTLTATSVPAQLNARDSQDQIPSPATAQPTNDSPKRAGGSRHHRPLSKSHLPNIAAMDRPSHLSRESSDRSIKSANTPEEKDLDMSDNEGDHSDENNEDGDENGPPSKKKKGQRFFCTEFPPCNLSFTRSEHLARHIRKHTGERPFQCHCNRRFSRLDNLRQHAQTVHVNEDIPGDSLAATGTRFQRQIRTDRVRPPGARSRAGTVGSSGGHGRGHSRNLSTSSIASTTSTFSNAQDRRRPPSLVMLGDGGARARASLDSYGSPPTTPTSQFSVYTHSPGGFSTPTSANFSGGPTSPSYGSVYGSPSHGMTPWDHRGAGRRLSVPAGPHVFEDRHQPMPMTFGGPLPTANGPGPAFSNHGSSYASPTSSNFSFNQHEAELASEAELRRRTWHPSSHWNYQTNYPRPATSGLSYSQTPDAPQPAFASNATTAASQRPRLPGIESFDKMSFRPPSPPRRQPSPMMVDERPPATAPPAQPNPSASREPRRSHLSWDLGLHSNLNKLSLQGTNSPGDGASQWSRQTIGEIQNTTQQSQTNYAPTTQPHRPAPIAISQEPLPPSDSQQTTPRKYKRQGWYNGPIPSTPQSGQQTRTSPEESSSSEGILTPSSGTVDYHPAVVPAESYPEHATHQHYTMSHDSQPPTQPSSIYALPPHAVYGSNATNPASDMGRLEALVAVATSEEQSATKSY